MQVHMFMWACVYAPGKGASPPWLVFPQPQAVRQGFSWNSLTWGVILGNCRGLGNWGRERGQLLKGTLINYKTVGSFSFILCEELWKPTSCNMLEFSYARGQGAEGFIHQQQPLKMVKPEKTWAEPTSQGWSPWYLVSKFPKRRKTERGGRWRSIFRL